MSENDTVKVLFKFGSGLEPSPRFITWEADTHVILMGVQSQQFMWQGKQMRCIPNSCLV